MRFESFSVDEANQLSSAEAEALMRKFERRLGRASDDNEQGLEPELRNVRVSLVAIGGAINALQDRLMKAVADGDDRLARACITAAERLGDLYGEMRAYEELLKEESK